MAFDRVPLLVHELVEHTARRHADQPVLIDGDDVHRYGDIDESAGRFASVLGAVGVVRGDRVGLLAVNSAFYATAYYGVLKAGAVVVPLNTASDPADVAYFLDNCDAKVLIVGSTREHVARAALAHRQPLTHMLTEGMGRNDVTMRGHITSIDLLDAARATKPSVDTSVDAADLASVIYTSGSTGRPRGVMLTHANIVANTHSITSYLELTPADRVLALLPFHYVFGKSLLNTHVSVGGSVVIENRFMYPGVAVDSLERTECTGLPGVPSTFQILLDQTDLGSRDLPALRYACQAGGAMSPATTHRLIDALPGKQIFVMYGCTEASARLSYLPPSDLARHVGKIGKAIPGVSLRVLLDDGTESADGEVGELVAQGPNVMQGYWGDPESTATVLDQMGLHTGDLAMRDSSGYFTIVGRKTEMIKSGGHRIAPQEIEEAIAEQAGVAEVAVIGVPDAVLGESITAFVVPTDARQVGSHDFANLVRATAASRLPRYKLPATVVVRAWLPKNEAGKLLKRELRDEYGSVPPT